MQYCNILYVEYNAIKKIFLAYKTNAHFEKKEYAFSYNAHV